MEKKFEDAQIEEIEPIRTIGSKEVGDTPEEKAQKEAELKEQKIAEAKKKAKEFAEQIVKKQFRSQFLQVWDEVHNHGKTLEQIEQEIDEKKSKMTKSARDFVKNFERTRIEEWIDDENAKLSESKEE